jgi:hypothetical protein
MRPFDRMEPDTMISLFKRSLAGLLVAIGFALPASATTYSTDFTDLWWAAPAASENGWGINLIQQNDVIFATLFVYGTDNTARWFVASDLRGNGGATFTGTLFQTTGPYFGAGAFNPANVTVTGVGSMSISFDTINTGTLTYSVNGVTVTKRVTRQTFATNNLAGKYLGGMTANGTGCTAGNQQVLIFDLMDVTHSANNTVSATVTFFNSQGVSSTCTFTGGYAQAGRLGSINGSFSCTFGTQGGNQGTFTVSEIDASLNGFTGRFTGRDQFCSAYTGFFGGVRDVR